MSRTFCTFPVVPAEAGTHSPGARWFGTTVPRSFGWNKVPSSHVGGGVWVPAFAGTTCARVGYPFDSEVIGVAR